MRNFQPEVPARVPHNHVPVAKDRNTAAMRYRLLALVAAGLGLAARAQADGLYSPQGQEQAVQQAQHTALCELQAELTQADSDAAVAAKVVQMGLMSPQQAATAIANAHRVSGCPAGPAS